MDKIIYNYNGKEYDITTIVTIIKNDNNGTKTLDACEQVLELFNVDGIEFETIFDDIIITYCPEKSHRCLGKKSYDEPISTPQPTNVPKCPTCQSTNIEKISTTSKAVSVGLFGLFSQKVKRQFCCKNCGYEW